LIAIGWSRHEGSQRRRTHGVSGLIWDWGSQGAPMSGLTLMTHQVHHRPSQTSTKSRRNTMATSVALHVNEQSVTVNADDSDMRLPYAACDEAL
jgi:hypothetical protein